VNADAHGRPKDRLWPLYLAVALALTPLVGGRWNAAPAAWIAPLFLARFFRTWKAGPGFMLACVLSAPLVGLSLWGQVPLSGLPCFAFIVVTAVFRIAPFLVDRLAAPGLRGFSSTLVLPLAFVAAEFVNCSTNPYGSWGALAYTQFGDLPLLQIVAVTGIYGVAFLLLWVAATVNWMWDRGFEWRRIRRGVVASACVVSAVLLAGGARLALWRPDAGTVQVACISMHAQEFLSGAERAGGKPEGDVRGLHDALLALSLWESRAGARMVCWSEGAAAGVKEDEPYVVARGCALARLEGVYLVMSLANVFSEQDATESKVVFVSDAGEVVATYVRARAIPGERAVLGDGRIPVVETPFGRVAVAVGLDMDFPALIRQAGRQRADILVAPAQDWQAATPLHAQMAAFRGMENGCAVVRPTALGLSLATDDQGRVLATMDSFATKNRVMTAYVPTRGSRTLYPVVGDAFAWACVAGLGVLLAAAALRKETPAAAVQTPGEGP
jgi:apolipoprotein N-acyltransferase